MVIAARCPTGAPADLQAAWKGFIGALEDVYFEDLDAADAANEVSRLLHSSISGIPHVYTFRAIE
jgi:hypothetical protein